jgi:pantoate--beta-alanine ligase
MQVHGTIDDICGAVAGFRAGGETVALVQTGGALHAGHAALIAQAKKEAARIIATVPGPPAPPDLTLMRNSGVDVVFTPDPAGFGPDGAQTIVEPAEFSRILYGKLRPGHYRTVATVTARMFNVFQPDVACYGETDYQRLCVIRQMVRDLGFPVRIVSMPTLRDGDGLAISARNARLTLEDRAAAAVMPRALAQAEEMARTGITVSRLRAWVAAHIQAEPRADLHLADIRDALTLASLSGPVIAPAVILLAVRFGGVLLIDQRVLVP